jgi:hypothetical protein
MILAADSQRAENQLFVFADSAIPSHAAARQQLERGG